MTRREPLESGMTFVTTNRPRFGDGFASPPPTGSRRQSCTQRDNRPLGCATHYHRPGASCNQEGGDSMPDSPSAERCALSVGPEAVLALFLRSALLRLGS